MKKVVLPLLTLVAMVTSVAVFAIDDIGGVASKVTDSLGGVARLITAGSYVAGMAFMVAAIVKFKAHKENATQIPIGTPIALLFVGAALIFVPTVFGVGGKTLFGEDAKTGGISGTTGFGATVINE